MRALEKYKEGDIVFLDIETSPLVEKLEVDTPLYDSWEYKKRRDNSDVEDLIESYSKEAALFPEFARIVVISVGRIVDDELILKSYNDKDEWQLLNNFNEDLKKVFFSNPKTVFGTFAGKGFDLPFIFKRMIVNKIKPATILDISGLKPWEIDDIDLKDLWVGTSFSRASLINVAVALGLPSPKDEMAGYMVGEYFYKGKIKEITKYCEKDVLTTANIYRKLMFKEAVKVSKSSEVNNDVNLIQYLYYGGEFTNEIREKLKNALLKLSDKEFKKAVEILHNLPSNRKDRKTDITLTKIKKFTDEVAKER